MHVPTLISLLSFLFCVFRYATSLKEKEGEKNVCHDLRILAYIYFSRDLMISFAKLLSYEINMCCCQNYLARKIHVGNRPLP